MSCKTVNTREDIDFNAHLIEIKDKRDNVVVELIGVSKLLDFYNAEGLNIYSVYSEIKSSQNNYSDLIAQYNRQMLCSHEDITFDKCTGHNSHKDFYDTLCNDCSLVFDHYDI